MHPAEEGPSKNGERLQRPPSRDRNLNAYLDDGQLYALFKRWIPLDLFPVLMQVCWRWRNVAVAHPGSGGLTRLDVACWGAYQGDLAMLHYGTEAQGRRKLGQREGVASMVYRQIYMGWAAVRMGICSMLFRQNVRSEAYERASQDLVRLDSHLRNAPPPRLCQSAIRGSHPEVLALVFGDQGPNRVPPPPTNGDLAYCIEHGSAEAYFLLRKWRFHNRVDRELRVIPNTDEMKTADNRLRTHAVNQGRLDIVKRIYTAREMTNGVNLDNPSDSAVVFSDEQDRPEMFQDFHTALAAAHTEMVEWFCRRYRANSTASARCAIEFLYLLDELGPEATVKDFPKMPKRDPSRPYPEYPDPVVDWDWNPLMTNSHATYHCYCIAAERQHMAAMDWVHRLVQYDQTVMDKVACRAAGRGRLKVLQWMMDHRCGFDAEVARQACIGNQLETLIWLRERGCPWHEVRCAQIAHRDRYPEMLRWIEANSELGPGLARAEDYRLPHRWVQLKAPSPEDDDESGQETAEAVVMADEKRF